MADVITPYTKEALTEQGWTFEEAYIPDPPIHDDRIFEIELPTLASDTFTTIPRGVSDALLQAVDDKKIIVVKPTEENSYPDGKASFVAYATYEDGEYYTHISLDISVAPRTMLSITVNHPNDLESETARVYVSEHTIDNRDNRIREFDLTNGINAEKYAELENALSPQRLVFIRFRGRTSVVPASVVGVGYISLYGVFNESGLQHLYIKEDTLEITVRSLSDYERIRVAVSRATTGLGVSEYEKLFKAADLGKGISVYDTITQTTMPAAYTKGGYNSENLLPEYVVITVFAPQAFPNQIVYDRMFRIYAQNRVGSGFTLSIREFRSKAFDEITS